VAARWAGYVVRQGSIPELAGARLMRPNVALTMGGHGHVYQNAAKGEWYEIRVHGRGSWVVGTYIGADCPCGG